MKNETEVIQDVLAGVDRYAELVERYHVGLIIHCEHIIKDRDAAEDVAQEAFVKAYLDLKRYDSGKSRFSTWLYKIATNLALDYMRKHKRQMTVDDVEALAEATMPTYLEDEARDEIRKAVESLVPPEYRRVIEAYYWEGKTYQQIAEAEGVPLNTARTWLRRAKLQLKEAVL
jgi:RNA polymerase sigma-70 factor (ECF subfamily)